METRRVNQKGWFVLTNENICIGWFIQGKILKNSVVNKKIDKK